MGLEWHENRGQRKKHDEKFGRTATMFNEIFSLDEGGWGDVRESHEDRSIRESLPDIHIFFLPVIVPGQEVKRICLRFGELRRFRYLPMTRGTQVEGWRQVFLGYTDVSSHEQAVEQVGRALSRWYGGREEPVVVVVGSREEIEVEQKLKEQQEQINKKGLGRESFNWAEFTQNNLNESYVSNSDHLNNRTKNQIDEENQMFKKEWSKLGDMNRELVFLGEDFQKAEEMRRMEEQDRNLAFRMAAAGI